MFAKHILWSLWAQLPVAGLAWHNGPGQRAYTEDRARDLLAEAHRLEAQADQAQAAAHVRHLASLSARKAALASKAAPDAQAAKEAAAQEDAAYQLASAAWQAGAESLECRLFAEKEIPWEELAFAVMRETLARYFHDRPWGRFRLHTGSIAPPPQIRTLGNRRKESP